jgi:hypothetical protein
VDSPKNGFQTMRRIQPAGRGRSGKLWVDGSGFQITEHPHNSRHSNSRWKLMLRNVSVITGVVIQASVATQTYTPSVKCTFSSAVGHLISFATCFCQIQPVSFTYCCQFQHKILSSSISIMNLVMKNFCFSAKSKHSC